MNSEKKILKVINNENYFGTMVIFLIQLKTNCRIGMCDYGRSVIYWGPEGVYHMYPTLWNQIICWCCTNNQYSWWWRS